MTGKNKKEFPAMARLRIVKEEMPGILLIKVDEIVMQGNAPK